VQIRVQKVGVSQCLIYNPDFFLLQIENELGSFCRNSVIILAISGTLVLKLANWRSLLEVIQMTKGNLTIFMFLLVPFILWPVKGLAENQYILLSVLTDDYVFDTVK